MANEVYIVTNRSASRVHYSVPDLGVKSRDFMPGEKKKIRREELEALSYMPGGVALIRDYLLIENPNLRADLVGHVEPEYNMTEKEVRDLIISGTHDEWLDCLDFAPEGVIDLIKTLAVEMPLTDTVKMEQFKQKKGIDLARMIQAKREEEAELAAAGQQTQPAQRRVQPAQTAEPQTLGRRTSGSKYKVVKKDTE